MNINVPKTRLPETAREKWLTNTLYALRFHFQKARSGELQWPENVKDNAEALVVYCMDNTLQEKQWLAPKGQAYGHDPAGAAIQPKTNDIAEKLQVLYGSTATSKTPYPKSLIIIGHEQCKANRALHDGLRDNTNKRSSSVLKKMYPMAPEGLKEAIQSASDRNVNSEDVIPFVEKSTVLQSMKNMYGQSFTHGGKEYRVSDLVNNGTFQIIGAMRGRTSPDDKPPLPLSVYDPYTKQFTPVETLYTQAFGHEPGEDALGLIEARKQANAIVKMPEAGSVIATKGATSRTVHEWHMDKINEGAHLLLEAIKELKGVHL